MSASFYDLLKFAKTGIAAPSMTAYDKQKALAMCKAGFPVKTLTGVPPISFQSDGSALTAWSIKGNEQQTGTPTPTVPITPDETGDKTANLFDEQYPSISTALRYIHIYVGDGEFTLSTTCPRGGDGLYPCLFFLTGQATSGASTGTNDVRLDVSRTVTATDGYVTIAYRGYEDVSPVDYETMLNTGSTALPYEPFGYKLTITLAGQTQNIYLSEPLRKIGDYADKVRSDGVVERKVKKLVLRGTENFYQWDNGLVYLNHTIISDADRTDGAITSCCSHFKSEANRQYASQLKNDGCAFRSKNVFFAMKPSTLQFADLAEFKQWLSDEYSAGHPVEVWYVLATAQTETVTTPALTPQKGANTLTVDTDLQPSEVSITGRIKQA